MARVRRKAREARLTLMVLGADLVQLIGCCSVPLIWFWSDGELELF